MKSEIYYKSKNYSIKIATDTNGDKYLEIDCEQGGTQRFKIINEGSEDFIRVLEKDIKLSLFINQRKREKYKSLLKGTYSEIENIVILSGAGTSVSIGKIQKGQTMAGLWDLLQEEHKSELEYLVRITSYDSSMKDLEVLLSKAGMHNKVSYNEELENNINLIKEFIVNKCTLEAPENSPHEEIIQKITLRPQKFPRAKIFTLNYDTLFEQAASRSGFTVIDGFTFTEPRIFNGKYFDFDIIETRHTRQDKTDNIIPKLFYLYKMHGSLRWKLADKVIQQTSEICIPVNERVMIFPQDTKYEHSYEQPYFEMMARFQQTLRSENTLLITIGFSFIDKHISSVIIESLKQNPSLNVFAISYPQIIENKFDFQKDLHSISELQSRVVLISEKFEDFAKEFPENIAHKRYDILEELSNYLNKDKL